MLTSLNVHGYSVDVLCNMQSTAAGFNQIETFCRLNYPNTLREGLGYWLSRVLKFLAWILSALHKCTSLVSTSFWKLCCHSARLPLPQYRSYWRCSKCGHSHWHSGQIETSSTKAPLSTEQLLLFWFWEWLKHFKWKGWSFSTTRLLAWKCLFVCRDKKWMFGKMT